jgi:hypothetical protein
VDLGWFLQVYNVDVALGGRNHEQLVELDVHAVDAFLGLQHSHGLRGVCCAQVEVFDCLVPGTGDQDLLASEKEPADALNAELMRLPSSGGVEFTRGCGCEVVVEDSAVCSADGDLGAVLNLSEQLYVTELRSDSQWTMPNKAEFLLCPAASCTLLSIFPGHHCCSPRR